MSPKTHELDSVLLRKVATVGITALVLVYAIAIISRPSITPEMGLGYLMLEKIKTLHQALRKFTSFDEPWYRPFTFYLTDFLVFQLIDIHNIYLIKIISVSVICFTGFIVTELSKRIFGAGLIERAIVFALVVTHPLYYAVALDGSGIVDPIFNSFLNITVICFVGLLESMKNKISSQAPMDGGNRTTLTILTCIFILCTITSHERGLAVFAIIGALYLYYYAPDIRRGKLFPDREAAAVGFFSLIAFGIYLFYVFGAKQGWSGEDYRTAFEPKYILGNLIKAASLPFRVHVHPMGKGYDVHLDRTFNLLAVPFLIALAAYIVDVFRNDDRQEKNRLAIVTLLYLCALPIPVWCGGNSWHFYTASIYISVATGRALAFWLTKLSSNAYLPPALLVVLFVWLIGATVRGINQEMPRENTGPMFMLDEAMHDPVLKNPKLMPDVVYYDTGSWGSLTWAFGGQGHLFAFLYSNPNIVEIALVNGKVLASDRPLCPLAAGKKALYFGFDVEHFSWHTIPEKNYCAL